jgi:hypothetical protein
MLLQWNLIAMTGISAVLFLSFRTTDESKAPDVSIGSRTGERRDFMKAGRDTLNCDT